MKIWHLQYILNDWDNDDDRGIILQVEDYFYMTEEKARIKFEYYKEQIDPDSYEEGEYEEKVVRKNYILLEERQRAQMLTLTDKDVEE